jgi:ribonuclease G
MKQDEAAPDAPTPIAASSRFAQRHELAAVPVSRKMLIETDAHQVRIAILENDRLTEVYVEPADRQGVVGNLYRGRVTRVLPGMQAAFVDIGLERDAFLYVSDVTAFDGDDVDEEELPANRSEAVVPIERPAIGEPSISDLLRTGQEVLVQVSKDPLGNKGARVTTHVTLPSRYLVLLPTMRHQGVSRRIEDPEERERLRGLLEELALPDTGWIVRTAGEGRSSADFHADAQYLRSLWEQIRGRERSAAAPSLVHRDVDPALRVVRDVFGSDTSVLWVDDPETYERIVEFLAQVQPALVERVRLDTHTPVFERFGIEEEIEAALQSKVWLKSGGYLVINQTEALVAIDVNTGRYVGAHSLEDTALRTNLEAVREIVRQIRLRDLSGILVVDLIDMAEAEHRDQVFAALESELRKDRAKSKVLNISEFGLVEITRKRSRTNLERTLTRRCPYCSGSGRIKALRTICLDIRRQVLRAHRQRGAHRDVLLRLHPEVVQALQTDYRDVLSEMERVLATRVVLQGDRNLHHEQFDLTEV